MMRGTSIPLNVWLSVPGTWKPQLPVAASIAKKFLFHHIRSSSTLSLAPSTQGMKNDVLRITARQISIIAGMKQGLLVCATVTDPTLDKFNRRFSAGEFQDLLRNGKVGLWHISPDNLFQGPYEVFNGPNEIDIT